MGGHTILHAMNDMSEGSRGASVLEQSSFSVSFVEKIIKESGSRLGYGELKNKQMEAILSFVQGNDTFVALPTGYGSLLVQICDTSNTKCFSSSRKESGMNRVCT